MQRPLPQASTSQPGAGGGGRSGRVGDLPRPRRPVSQGKHSTHFLLWGGRRVGVSSFIPRELGMTQNEAEVRGQVRARLSRVCDLYDLGY